MQKHANLVELEECCKREPAKSGLSVLKAAVDTASPDNFAVYICLIRAPEASLGIVSVPIGKEEDQGELSA